MAYSLAEKGPNLDLQVRIHFCCWNFFLLVAERGFTNDADPEEGGWEG